MFLTNNHANSTEQFNNAQLAKYVKFQCIKQKYKHHGKIWHSLGYTSLDLQLCCVYSRHLQTYLPVL